MKINKSTIKIITDMEYIIGSQCYNPNSYNGWTGEEGCSFRYPVYTAKEQEGTYEAYKYRGHIDEISPNEVDTIKYKFGSNHLYIGEGLEKILTYLEDRYDIDFEKMEKEKRKLKSA